MNPNTLVLIGISTLAGASFIYGTYAVGKAVIDTVGKIKEENRQYQRELAKP